VTCAMWSLVLVCLEIVLVLVQENYTACANHLVASFWTNPMVLQGEGAQVEARFSPFGDSCNLDAR
jgi:hypothetical protein